MEITSVYNVKIESNRIIIYKSLEGYYREKNKTSFTTEKNPKGIIKGKLSDNAKKHIKNIVLTWISTIQFYLLSNGYSLTETNKRLKFITLTLSDKQKHDDKTIKRKMLDRFIILIKRKYGVKNYLWIAETQKNGNIHFHLLTDINIHHKLIRKHWNKIQQDNRYLDNYYRKHKHYNANSTDIHSLKKINNIGAYLTKEITKGQSSRKIIGKLWGCSDNLLKLKSFETLMSYETEQFLERLEQQQNTRTLKDNWFSLLFFESIKFFDLLDFNELPELYNYYKEQMKILFYD